jgi:hypothetical protein
MAATLAEWIICAMTGGGMMSNQDIYRETKRIFRAHGATLPPNFESQVRQNLQAYCPSRPQYKGRDDLFVWYKKGYWSCKA